MKKILIAMPEFSYGGAEKQVSYLADGLSDYFDVTVLVYHSYELKESNNQLTKVENIKEVCFSEIGMKAKFLSSISFSKWLRKEYKENEFDVAIIYSPLSLLVSKSFSKISKRIIYLERNSGVKTLKRFSYRRNLHRFDKIICNSISATDLFCKNGLYAEYISNGIKISTNEIEKRDFLFEKAIIPARISEIKNQKYIIKNLDNYGIKLFLAGPIEDNDYYNSLLEYNEINKCKFDYLGVVKNVDKLYDEYDFVILPSISEGTPNVILEAFARKVFCIASNIEMNKQLFKNKKLLFDINDENSFIECLNYIRSLSYEEIINIINENYKFVNEFYSIDKMVNNYLMVINKM